MLFKKMVQKSESDPGLESLEEQVRIIQNGNRKLRDQLISDYRPYIAKLVSRFSKRYIDPQRDDEFSVALSAFNEAIDHYSPESGTSFLPFASTVIRRRLIDYVRREQKFLSQIPYSAFEYEDEEDNTLNPVELLQAIRDYERKIEAEERKNEILELDRMLQDYGIRFGELVKISPKHEDSRLMLMEIGVNMAKNRDLMQMLRETRRLPIKQLLEQYDISRKTLERNRKYIIAIALIHSGSFPYLQGYLANNEVQSSGREASCTKVSFWK